MTLEDNIAARRAATDAWDVFVAYNEDTLGRLNEEQRGRFWEELHRKIGEKLPKEAEEPPPKPTKFSDEDAMKWGRRKVVPFGEFQGMVVNAADLSRLQWYADQRFIDGLRMYLASDVIQHELEVINDDD